MIDDYGHHPVEIAAVLKAARQAGARDVIAVVQPHRYSRLQSLFAEFCTCMNDAGTVIVADVYAAGEAPIPGVNRDALVEGLRARGHRSVVPLPGPEQLAEMVHAHRAPGDFVVCLGAGNITAWAAALPAELARAAGRRQTRRVGCMMAAAPHPALSTRLPAAARPGAGGCAAGSVHLVPRRRPGGGAGAPGRRATISPRSCAALPLDVPVHGASAPAPTCIVRDGGIAGVVIRLARGFADIDGEAGRRRRRRRVRST